MISHISRGTFPEVTNNPYEFLKSVLPADIQLYELFRSTEQEIIPRKQVVDFLTTSIVKVLSIIQERVPNLRSPQEQKIVTDLSKMARFGQPVDMEFRFKVMYRYFGVPSSNHQ